MQSQYVKLISEFVRHGGEMSPCFCKPRRLTQLVCIYIYIYVTPFYTCSCILRSVYKSMRSFPSNAQAGSLRPTSLRLQWAPTAVVCSWQRSGGGEFPRLFEAFALALSPLSRLGWSNRMIGAATLLFREVCSVQVGYWRNAVRAGWWERKWGCALHHMSYKIRRLVV